MLSPLFQEKCDVLRGLVYDYDDFYDNMPDYFDYDDPHQYDGDPDYFQYEHRTGSYQTVNNVVSTVSPGCFCDRDSPSRTRSDEPINNVLVHPNWMTLVAPVMGTAKPGPGPINHSTLLFVYHQRARWPQ